MCGIAGWYCYGKQRPTGEELKTILVNLSQRGKHATGIGWKDGDIFRTLKGAMPAEDFLRYENVAETIPEALKSNIVFLHCRNATHGNPSNLDNDHPITNNGGVIMHNGVVSIRNGEVFEAKGGTDSEQLLLCIQKYGWKGLEKVDGSMTFAFMNVTDTGFFLFAHHNPLVWYFDADRSILFFYSTEDILKRSITVPTRFGGLLPKHPIVDVPEDTVYHVSKGGIHAVYALPVLRYTPAEEEDEDDLSDQEAADKDTYVPVRYRMGSMPEPANKQPKSFGSVRKTYAQILAAKEEKKRKENAARWH